MHTQVKALPLLTLSLRHVNAINHAMQARGLCVWGGYVSPVHDAYGKPGLESARHRLAMCRAAFEEVDGVMVDDWEAWQVRVGQSVRLKKGPALGCCACAFMQF